MCIHPEALTRVKNFSPHSANAYHTVNRHSDHKLPSKAQWMIRNTNHPETQQEKFQLLSETEEIRS